METFSALLAICAGNSPITDEFPAQKPVTRSFGVLFDLRLNKWLSKQSWGWWFETLSHPLWRYCNDDVGKLTNTQTNRSKTKQCDYCMHNSWAILDIQTSFSNYFRLITLQYFDKPALVQTKIWRRPSGKSLSGEMLSLRTFIRHSVSIWP